MKTLKSKWVYDEILVNYYFGVGLGVTYIDRQLFIILPFVLILVTQKEEYQ